MTLAVPRPLLVAATLGSLLAFPAGAGAVGAFPGGDDGGNDAPALSAGVGEPDFDVRKREALTPEPPPPSLGAARADLRRALGRQGVLDLDPVTGTPRIVARLDGFLTGAERRRPGRRRPRLRPRQHRRLRPRRRRPRLPAPRRDTPTAGASPTSPGRQEFGGVPSFDNGLKRGRRRRRAG